MDHSNRCFEKFSKKVKISLKSSKNHHFHAIWYHKSPYKPKKNSFFFHFFIYHYFLLKPTLYYVKTLFWPFRMIDFWTGILLVSIFLDMDGLVTRSCPPNFPTYTFLFCGRLILHDESWFTMMNHDSPWWIMMIHGESWLSMVIICYYKLWYDIS